MFRYIVLVLTFLTNGFPLYGDDVHQKIGGDAIRAYSVDNEIEVFGRSLFLLRISEKQKFEIRIHSHLKDPCEFDVGKLQKKMAQGLRSHGFLVNEKKAEFVMFLEVYGGEHPMHTGAAERRCLGGYRVAFMQQHHDQIDHSYVSRKDDYEPATILMLRDGIFDVQQTDLERHLEQGSTEVVHGMVLVIEDIRDHYKNQ